MDLAIGARGCADNCDCSCGRADCGSAIWSGGRIEFACGPGEKDESGSGADSAFSEA